MQLSEPDTRPYLEFDVQLPELSRTARLADVSLFWLSALKRGSEYTEISFTKTLGLLKEQGIIKRFNIAVSLPFELDSDFGGAGELQRLRELGTIDFKKNDYIKISYIRIEIAFLRSGKYKPPPNISVGWDEPYPFISINRPWEIRVHSVKTNRLKTQDNFVFKGFVGVKFPLLKPQVLINQDSCAHEFRILDLGVWEWRLVWECKKCGFLCYCSCFERAIKEDPNQSEFLRQGYEVLDIKVADFPFWQDACDVCRGVPSTNRFCADMYARSEFEVRYGAYIRKKMVEMRLDGVKFEDAADLEIAANNAVRQSLGFKPIGKGWVKETELFRIISSIFEGEEVIHHYRAPWLEGLEIDIFVPSRHLAIEYHGIQHFEPVGVWGGEPAYEKTLVRDEKKERLCIINGVTLIAFHYDEDITVWSVKAKLSELRII